MLKPLVYVETSVISYLVSRPSRDLLVAGHQQVTQDWWEHRRSAFRLAASELVVEEASQGDEQAAREQLEILEHLELLAISEDALALARQLVDDGPLPQKAAEDALHIAIAVTNGAEFLLTWNHKHLANAAMRAAIDRICRHNGFEPSILCTPEDLLEE